MDFTLGNIMEKITDRLPNFLIIESLKTKLDSKVKTLKINLLHFTLEKLKNGILALNLWGKIEFTKDNQKYELFHKNLLKSLTKMHC